MLEEDNDNDDSANENQQQQTSAEWMKLFGSNDNNTPKQHSSISEKARILASKILLGATVPQGLNENNEMEYSFKRPIGGYNDVLYGDDTLQILRGQHGSMYVLHGI